MCTITASLTACLDFIQKRVWYFGTSLHIYPRVTVVSEFVFVIIIRHPVVPFLWHLKEIRVKEMSNESELLCL